MWLLAAMRGKWGAAAHPADGHCLQLAQRQLLKGRTRVLLVQMCLRAVQHLETALWQACSCLELCGTPLLVEAASLRLGGCVGASQVE